MAKPESLIPENHLAAIGMIATWWATLEFEVDRTTWHLSSIGQNVGACLTAQIMSIHGKLKALIAVTEQVGLDDDLRAKLAKFQNSIGGLVEARNRAVHDPRMRNQETGAVHRLQITAPKSLTFEMKPEPVESLWQIAANIKEKIDEFYGLRAEIVTAFDKISPVHTDLVHETPAPLEPAPASAPARPARAPPPRSER